MFARSPPKLESTPSPHKLTLGSALQIHIGTFEHRFLLPVLMSNPDWIPMMQMRKMISGSMRKSPPPLERGAT